MTENKEITKVALYARVSTEEQKANFSLASQMELLRKHAADNKYDVCGEYIDDGYSGTSFERPQFKRLMEDSQDGKFQLVLVYRVDRFFRNNKHLLNTVDELKKSSVSIRSITEPFDTSTYLGNFVLSLFGSIAELERNTFMERSKLGKLRRAREGYYSGSSPTRFGYVYNKTIKKIEIDEKEAEVVRLAFEFYNQPDSSILKVTRKLRELRYRTKEGHEMREDAVHDMLRDSIYIGKWHANKHDSKTKGLKPSKDWIEVSVPRIISDEAFYRTQELLESRRNYSERNAKYDYLLQGMVKCADCGNTVAGTADKQVTVKNGKKYGPYFKLYYRCTHFVKNRFDKIVKCRLRYVQARKLEDAVWNEVSKIFQNPDLIEHAIRNRPDVDKLGKDTAEKELSRISMLQEGLAKEEHRILEAYRQSIITIEQLREQMDSLRSNRETLEKTKQDLMLLLNKEDKRAEIKNAIEYVKKIKENMKQFSYEKKKEVLRLLNTAIKVNIDGKIDIDCFLPAIPTVSDRDILSCIAPARPILWRSAA